MLSFGGYVIAAENEQVIKITAKRFEYSPKEITRKEGRTSGAGIHLFGQAARFQLSGA